MRELLAGLVCFGCVGLAYGQAGARVVEHGVYAVHLIQRPIGTEEYSVSGVGAVRKLVVKTETSDRGMRRVGTTTLDYRALDFAPMNFEQHAVTPAAGKVAAVDRVSVTEISGNTVTVREGDASRSMTKPAVGFVGFANMPAAAQMLMMRYWLKHGRPQRLMLMRASAEALPVEIQAVGHDVFRVNGAMVRLARYTVGNLVFGREVLWMNDRGRLAAVMTFAGGLPQEEVLDEYKSAFDPLFGSGVRQEMLDLATLTHAVKPEATGSYAIVGARLIDATGAGAVEKSVVVVRDGKIAAVGAAGTTAVPDGMRVIHAEGQSLLPGLWEMHSHYSGVEFGPALMAAGITTARDCGGELLFLMAMRHAIEEEHQLGPRLLLAGLVDGANNDAFGLFTAGTAEEGKNVVDMYADAHFEQIKVYTQIQPEVLRAISEEAHKRGLTVTGHVPAAVNTFEGVEDGMDQINHLQFVTKSMVAEWSAAPFVLKDLSSERAKKLIALLVAKHIVVDPTVAWGEMAGHPKSIPTEGLEPGVKAAPFPLAWRFNTMGVAGMDETKFNQGMDAKLQVIGALFKAGVPIVAGSDTNLQGYGLDRELELYVQAGMTPLQAIQSATIVPARVMHHEGDSGTVEVGKRADLVLVMGNPLEKISALRQVVSVVSEGRMYDSKALGAVVGFRR